MSFFTAKISRKKLHAALAPYASDAKTLEVGAYGQPAYGRFFPNRIGIDVRPGPGVDQVASVYELPFPDSTLENVLCLSVLEHLQDPPKAIAEMHRVLKPGGRVLISVPFLFPIHDAPGDYWRFTRYGLQMLFQKGWEIVELRAETDLQSSLAVLLQRVAFQGRYRLDMLTKGMLFGGAYLLSILPRWYRRIFGDIRKQHEEPDAFASAFFLVARKQ